MGTQYWQQIEQAAQYIRGRATWKETPSLALILGSGLGDLAGQVEEAVAIPYADIPHFPLSTVEGHAGKLVLGKLEGKQVAVMQGRFHYYEGYPFRQVVFPVYVLRQLGCTALVITNAAGGLNRGYEPGDLMLLSDHMNLTGDNPLIGPNDERLGMRFPDMSEPYSREFRKLALQIADRQADEGGGGLLRLQQGVYCGISGPSYMTPAELMLLARIGGDAVGMSTVGEVIAANHCGLRVLGISCITDMAIGEELEPLTHEQVMAVAERTKPKFGALVTAFVREVEL